jgi:hypothetical protein
VAKQTNKKNKKLRAEAVAGESKHRAMRRRVMVDLERERLKWSLALAAEREQVLGEARAEAELIIRNANDCARAVMARAAREAESSDSCRISRLPRAV